MAMSVEVTVTYLEMTSPDQLRPGRDAPPALELRRHDRRDLPLVRSTYDRIGAPHGWIGRLRWPDEAWEELLSRPDVEVWLAWLGDEVAGMVELQTQSNGDVEIAVFGLVPEVVGKGLGAPVLVAGARLAWEARSPDGNPTTRVWLHTSSLDHPHAIQNYERRGFSRFRTERKQRELVGDIDEEAGDIDHVVYDE